MRELAHDREVVCTTDGIDRYRRIVARCAVDGVDLGAEMVRRGWALDFPKYSKGRHAADQAKAEAAGIGLWSGSFVAPWEWRASKAR